MLRAALAGRVLLQDLYGPWSKIRAAVAETLGTAAAPYGRARAGAGTSGPVALRQNSRALRRAGCRRRAGRAERGAECGTARRARDPRRQRQRIRRRAALP